MQNFRAEHRARKICPVTANRVGDSHGSLDHIRDGARDRLTINRRARGLCVMLIGTAKLLSEAAMDLAEEGRRRGRGPRQYGGDGFVAAADRRSRLVRCVILLC